MIYVDGNEYSFLNRWQETGRSGRPTRITPAEINDFSGGLFLIYCGAGFPALASSLACLPALHIQVGCHKNSGGSLAGSAASGVFTAAPEHPAPHR